MTLLDRARIATLIPHAGAMCLLDEVTQWDETRLRCVSRRFRERDNPLRRVDGSLGAASGIEIAAQAMAVHGRLVTGSEGLPVQGYLASVRDVRLAVPCLDDGFGDVMIDVERLMGDESGATYRFAVTGDGAVLIDGRATVLFEVAP